MKKLILLSLTLIFAAAASDSVSAQTDKKPDEKNQPTTTTVDAWRDAAPLSEQPLYVTAAPNDASEVIETSQQIEKRITGLEMKLAESLKNSDSPMLRQLLADDFMPVGRNIAESQKGKNGYIDWILKNGEHKAFTVEKVSVRVYGTDTAIATVHYRKIAGDGAATSNEGFVATDVWVKRGDLWQAASHHISMVPKQ